MRQSESYCQVQTRVYGVMYLLNKVTKHLHKSSPAHFKSAVKVLVNGDVPGMVLSAAECHLDKERDAECPGAHA